MKWIATFLIGAALGALGIFAYLIKLSLQPKLCCNRRRLRQCLHGRAG